MRKLKKGLASLLAVLMLVSVLPASALAEEADENTAAEVVFNLGTMEVTVGSDEEKAETAETPYDLFDGDGDYTLDLGPDAFFPYEVQFTYDGDTWTEWFMDAEDTVEVGGHTFSVETYVSDPAALTGLSFEIDGRTVTARPAEKEFTNEGPGMELFSLLPIKEYRYLDLDMTGYLPYELKAVGVSYILSGMKAENPYDDLPEEGADDLVVWAKGSGSDDFTIAEQNGTIDLSPKSRYTNYVDLEMIVGTDDQLDMSNIRYILDVDVTPSDELLTVTAYAAREPRQPIDVYDTYLWERSNNPTILEIGVDANDWTSGEMAYLSLGLNDEFDSTQFTATVYEGLYDSEEEAVAANAVVIDDIWEQENIATEGGHLADYSWKQNYRGMPEVTVVLKRGDTVALVCPVILYMYGEAMSLDTRSIYAEENGSYTDIRYGERWYWDNTLGMEISTITLDSGYPANGTYYLRMRMRNPADTSYTTGIDYVQHAAVGDFDTAQSIQAQPNIKEQLFSDSTGYPADYSRGVIFSVLDINGDIYQMKIMTEANTEDTELPAAPRPDSQDTYFWMESAQAKTEDGIVDLDAYAMPYKHDGYYYNGYQTVFLLNSDGTPVTAGSIVPEFYTGNKVTMYAGLDHISGSEQKSGETAIEFRDGEPIQYSAAAESAGHLKNYWVTFVTQQTGGPKLFVNAANDPDRVDAVTKQPVREVFLTEEYNYHHDVFFANIGNAAMTGVYVKLESAENVALDPYWTVREDAPAENRILGAFDSTDDNAPDGSYVSYGELANVAKVRLVPTEGSVGIISGTLVIGYEGGEEVRIKLTGTSGTPKITTETIVDGVKYVPYNSVIQTNSMGASDAVSFSVTSGSLPTGVTLFPNGKLYGMPTRAGSYTFTVTATYNGDDSLSDSKTFTITIKENTNDNVDAATDMGYTVLDRVPDTMTEYTDQVFRSEGTYSYFYKFYLDGRELTEGQDFDSEEGSTKITVRAQTFRNAGNGTHTIAAEFRSDKNDTNTVKRAAQNYTVSGGSSGSGSGTSKPAIKPPVTQPETPKTTADIFKDITAQDWYYADVDWAYQNKLMIGVTSDLYVPYGLISPATVVTVLARMDKVDLSRYDGVSYPEIADGQWYTNAAVWAKETGLLPEGTFSAVPPIARAKFAVMLVKYLESKGIDCTLPEAPVAFADAELMTQEENDAFQVLYQFGIFKGIGNYYMDPQGSTTRAQLAVLLHRLSVFVESHS